MEKNYKDQYSEIIQAAKNTHDRTLQLGEVLALPEYDEQRDALCNLCVDNPLALYRLWRTHEGFKTPNGLLSLITEHERRVRWQLRRVYRARNNLVHHGTSSSYGETLILNLDDYYRNSLNTILEYSDKEDAKSNIDQIVVDVGINYRFLIRKLNVRKSDENTGSEIFLLSTNSRP